jgi:hypothetical protein
MTTNELRELAKGLGKAGRALKGPEGVPKEGQIDPRDYGLFEVGYSPLGLTERFPIGLTKIYQLIEEGELHPLKLGKRTVIMAVDFAAFLARLKARGGTLGKGPNPKSRAKPKQEPEAGKTPGGPDLPAALANARTPPNEVSPPKLDFDFAVESEA